MWREREKKARNFESPTFRAPHFGAPPFGGSTLRSWPTLAKPTLANRVWPALFGDRVWPNRLGQRSCFSGMANFGQNRLWPNRLWPNRLWLCVCVFVCLCVCVVWRGCWFHGFMVWGFTCGCWFQGFGLVMFGAPGTVLPAFPRTAFPRTALRGPPFRGPPFPWTAQNVALCFPLPQQNSFFSSVSGSLLVECVVLVTSMYFIGIGNDSSFGMYSLTLGST